MAGQISPSPKCLLRANSSRPRLHTSESPTDLGKQSVEIWGLYMAIAPGEGRRVSPLAVTRVG